MSFEGEDEGDVFSARDSVSTTFEVEEDAADEEDEEDGGDAASAPSRSARPRPERGAAMEAAFVPDALRRTAPVMTKFEFTRLVAARALQIEEGALVAAERVPEGLTHALDIAEYEVRHHRAAPLALEVQRRVRSHDRDTFERWRLAELLLPEEVAAGRALPDAAGRARIAAFLGRREHLTGAPDELPYSHTFRSLPIVQNGV